MKERSQYASYPEKPAICQWQLGVSMLGKWHCSHCCYRPTAALKFQTSPSHDQKGSHTEQASYNYYNSQNASVLAPSSVAVRTAPPLELGLLWA